MALSTEGAEPRLAYVRVCVELGDLAPAELEVADLLEQHPDSLEALSLFAKIKHMRGELSLAMACWAQLRARDPEGTLAQLRALLGLAADPERGAAEFARLGRVILRHPAVHLELEGAFLQLLARRTSEARQRCERLARRHQTGDRDVYKLAMLAGAWIAELGGQPEQACEILESLGHEHGFEGDADRVLTLARLYERSGTPEQLEAAAHICETLVHRHARPSLLGRLANLLRRLGEHERAADYEQRFLVAFRARRHRPTFPDLVGVAAQRYLPLWRLRAIAVADVDLPEPASRRERALAAALTGALPVARHLFERSGELLDRKYLADLDVIEGDLGRAEAIYMDVLASDPGDLRIAGWLLDRFDETGSPQLGSFFRRSEIADPTRDALEAWIRATPLDPPSWRRLAVLGGLCGEAEADDALAHASTVESGGLPGSERIGHARAAAACHLVGRTRGVIHPVLATREPALPGQGGVLPLAQVHGRLGTEQQRAVQDIFLAVRDYARTRFPHLTTDLFEYTYACEICLEGERSAAGPREGLAAGLPAAIAFLSVFLQREIPTDIALAGVLATDDANGLGLRPVGDAAQRVKGAYECNLRALVLPAPSRSELRASQLVPLPIHDALVRYATGFDEAVDWVFEGSEPLAPHPEARGRGGGPAGAGPLAPPGTPRRNTDKGGFHALQHSS